MEQEHCIVEFVFFLVLFFVFVLVLGFEVCDWVREGGDL